MPLFNRRLPMVLLAATALLALASAHAEPGVPPSQIAGVYVRPSPAGGVGSELVLALKDGTCYGPLDVPPSDLNIAASRRSQPGRWGR